MKTTFETDIIAQYLNSNIPIKNILNNFKISRCHLYKILKINNIKTTNYTRARKYTLDETYLNNIDCEEKAYFLGFFCADGNNQRRNRSIRIKLAEQDKEILFKFNNLFKSNKPLYFYPRHDGQDQYELVFASRILSNKLIELNIPVRKTEELIFPEFLNKNLYNHFIRGYFDGDGSIGIYGENKTNFSFLSTRKFAKSVENIFKNELNIHSTIVSHPKKYQIDVVSLYVSGNKQIKKALHYLYKDSKIYLNRKYQKYLNFLDREEKNGRTRY